jgi:predicted nuclease with TOPRIM domain
MEIVSTQNNQEASEQAEQILEAATEAAETIVEAAVEAATGLNHSSNQNSEIERILARLESIESQISRIPEMLQKLEAPIELLTETIEELEEEEEEEERADVTPIQIETPPEMQISEPMTENARKPIIAKILFG